MLIKDKLICEVDSIHLKLFVLGKHRKKMPFRQLIDQICGGPLVTGSRNIYFNTVGVFLYCNLQIKICFQRSAVPHAVTYSLIMNVFIYRGYNFLKPFSSIILH